MKKMECKVCGTRIKPAKDEIYAATERLTPMELLTSKARVFDAIDCPRCGCQNLLAIREPRVEAENE